MKRVSAIALAVAIWGSVLAIAWLIPTVGWLLIGAAVAVLGCLLMPPAPVKG